MKQLVSETAETAETGVRRHWDGWCFPKNRSLRRLGRLTSLFMEKSQIRMSNTVDARLQYFSDITRLSRLTMVKPPLSTVSDPSHLPSETRLSAVSVPSQSRLVDASAASMLLVYSAQLQGVYMVVRTPTYFS